MHFLAKEILKKRLQQGGKLDERRLSGVHASCARHTPAYSCRFEGRVCDTEKESKNRRALSRPALQLRLRQLYCRHEFLRGCCFFPFFVVGVECVRVGAIGPCKEFYIR